MMLEEVDQLSDGRVVVSEVVSDDDSTLRSHCAAVENGGKLAEESANRSFSRTLHIAPK